MDVSKARIELIDSVQGVSSPIEVQFNPGEYTLVQASQIAEINIPGLASPILQFVRGQNRKLTLDLLFDASDGGMGENAPGMRKRVEAFLKLGQIEPNLHAPPRLKFIWGDLTFKAIIDSIQQKYSLFSPTGKWLRATFSVTFREYWSLQDQLKELNLQSADHSKRYIVKEGDTLTSIAHAMYGDAALWRPIAQKNNIQSPLRLQPGRALEIPPLDAFSQPRIAQT